MNLGLTSSEQDVLLTALNYAIQDRTNTMYEASDKADGAEIAELIVKMQQLQSRIRREPLLKGGYKGRVLASK